MGSVYIITQPTDPITYHDLSTIHISIVCMHVNFMGHILFLHHWAVYMGWHL